jgi:hypothetical protein
MSESEDAADGAALLRRILALVEDGTLIASTPEARALRARIEGAAVAAELVARKTRPGDDPSERNRKQQRRRTGGDG